MLPLKLREATFEDLGFLAGLWNDPRVMRYAGYPEGKGWSRSQMLEWWKRYEAEHSASGMSDVQLILEDAGGTRLGESRCGRVEPGFAVGDWRNPLGEACFMTDIKLAPEHWGNGIGTQGMRMIVEHAFTRTPCELLVVPPHRDNPAAWRVYEKAGFVRTGVEAWQGHEIMELTRDRFKELYRA